MQTIVDALSAMAGFPWSVSVPVMAIAAMIIFREPISGLIGRSHEFKAGRFFSLKAKPSGVDPRMIGAIVREAQESAPAAREADVDRLVIRDSNGKVRILLGVSPADEPFLVMCDEDGETRATLVSTSAANADRLTMLVLRGKGKAPDDIACLVGAERDGTGTIGVRDRSGAWKEMS